ncbi:TPA: hypothetical protein N0F65_004626 [Lagenidium giganteum]|uniref:PDZ domain-containing protein n=1 Tax=Lagenidium giganteum TaxID=4803 RepID=A0AAV2ZD39_9STRA|nr:TPA: hypothetical protein N0F65_004626 [Lagenidium giganteum]
MRALYAARLLLVVMTVMLAASMPGAAADKAKYSIALNGIPAGSAYTINVTVGSGKGANTFRLIADTGSSNDAVLGDGCCGSVAAATFNCDLSPTCDAKSASAKTTLGFAGATIAGRFLADQWSGDGFSAITKRFLVIEQQQSFLRPDYDGITGFAYSAIAKPQGSAPPSLYDDLVKAGGTPNLFGLLLCGIHQPMLEKKTGYSFHAGQWLIGGTEGTDGEKYYTGDVLYSPIVQEAWYVVTVSDIGFDGKSLGLDCQKYNEPQAIVDSGTSNLAFPSPVYNSLMAKIKAATLDAVPDFDTSFFDSTKSCCGKDYCDPSSSTSLLLKLPSMYISFAMQSDDGSTSKHYTVEIPPQYYWRPELNGVDNSQSCRAIGITEGSLIILGDVFMDGLYTVHDRANGKLGIAVADNCPNKAKSAKKVTVADKSLDWCTCFSSQQRTKSLWTRHLPWGKGCFFWVWWMYIVLVSIIIVLICASVLLFWWWKARRARAAANARQAHAQSIRSGPSDHSDVVLPPSKAAPTTRDPRTLGNTQSGVSDGNYSMLSSPRSLESDESSIAVLSAPINSPVSGPGAPPRRRPQGESDASDDSGFGDDLSVNDQLKLRIEKMRSMMSLASKKPEAASNPSKLQLRNEVNSKSPLSPADVVVASSGIPRYRSTSAEKLRRLSITDDTAKPEDNHLPLSPLAPPPPPPPAPPALYDEPPPPYTAAMTAPAATKPPPPPPFDFNQNEGDAAVLGLDGAEDEEDDDDEEEDRYTIVWESGLLGLLFKVNAAGRAVIRRVNKKGNAIGLHYARAGDVLVGLNGRNLENQAFESIVEELRNPAFPLHLEFRPMKPEDAIMPTNAEPPSSTTTPSPAPAMQQQVPPPSSPTASTATSVEMMPPLEALRQQPTPSIGHRDSKSTVEDDADASVDGADDEYDVTWDIGPLGCGLKLRKGMPVVKTVTGSGVSASVAQIREGDVLLAINGFLTEEIGFKGAVDLLQRAAKPVQLRFGRRRPSESLKSRPSSSFSSSSPKFTTEILRDSQLEVNDSAASQQLLPNQYPVLWKEGPLGVQIKPRSSDGAIIVARITGAGPTLVSDQIAVGDIFVRIAGIDVASRGIVATFELLKTVQKPVVLVFEREEPSVPSFRALREAHRHHPETDRGSQDDFRHALRARYTDEDRSEAGSHATDKSRDTDRYDPANLPPPPPYAAVKSLPTPEVPLPQFSDIENGRVTTASVDSLPPPPAYMDVFTYSGRERDVGSIMNDPESPDKDDNHSMASDSLEPPPLPPYSAPPPGRLPPVPAGYPPPPSAGYPRFIAENKTTEELRQMYLESERRRNTPQGMSATMMSTYSDLDDSGMLQTRPGAPPAKPAAGSPELWLEWSEGPLGITFKRTNGEIVVSRLTGAGYSPGIEQLRPGDWLVSFNNYSTHNLRLSETMALLKKLPKPISLRFIVR